MHLPTNDQTLFAKLLFYSLLLATHHMDIKHCLHAHVSKTLPLINISFRLARTKPPFSALDLHSILKVQGYLMFFISFLLIPSKLYFLQCMQQLHTTWFQTLSFLQCNFSPPKTWTCCSSHLVSHKFKHTKQQAFFHFLMQLVISCFELCDLPKNLFHIYFINMFWSYIWFWIQSITIQRLEIDKKIFSLVFVINQQLHPS